MKKAAIKFIFEGIYESFDQVPRVGEGFGGLTWERKARERLENFKKIPIVSYRDNLLPFLTSVASRDKSKVSVLDVGGGPGFAFLPTIGALGRDIDVSFYIVETERIYRLGKEMFGNDKRISFSAHFPRNLDKVDIVHFGSSMQYFENWKEVLKKAAKYKAKYILFSDLHAGNVPTYATAQIYYGSRIPCWFFNLEEFTGEMNKRGYELLFKAEQIVKYLGKERKLPQNNFPKKYRVGNTVVLLFAREN